MHHPRAALVATEQDPPGVRPLNNNTVLVEQIPAHTLEAITYLFPKKGLQIFTLLLGYAQVKQLALPDHGLVDVAVIVLPSIEYFARQHTLSKDTALRYIAMFELLGILTRQRNAEQSELHIPLVVWHPGENVLPTLDACLNSTAREKLRQLATGVKARFLLLYGTPHSWSRLLDDIRATLSDVQEHLTRHTSRSKRLLLHQRIHRLQCRLAPLQDIPSQEGDLATPSIHQVSSTAQHKGDLNHIAPSVRSMESIQKGDFEGTKAAILAQKGGLASPVLQQKGDFCATLTATSDLLTTQKGDLISPVLQQKGDLGRATEGAQAAFSRQKGDFEREMSALVHQKGDFQAKSRSVTTQKGDFQAEPPAASLNDNVITILTKSLEEEYVSDNDAAACVHVQEPYSPNVAAKVGRRLALFLENSPENTGGFVAKCKVCTPTVIQAAVIDVLVHQAFPTIDPADDRGRPRNKAKWFHRVCNEYSMPGAHIPAFITKWLRTDLYWQDLEAYWKEIAEQLDEAGARYRRYMIADAGSADLVRQWLRGEIEQQALDEALQSSVLSQQQQQPQNGSQPITSAPSAANGKPLAAAQVEKTWMDEDDAEILAEEILRDAGPLGVSRAVAKQEHGVYVVTLVWRGAPMTMKTPQQWRTHLQSVRPLFEKMQRKGESDGATK